MAVIGSRDNLNRDPAKMPRFNSESESTGIFLNQAYKHMNGSEVYRPNFLTAVIDTNSVANQQRTVYSVSGKGGFLLFAFGNGTDATNIGIATTFIITVDGVATTVALPTSGGLQNPRGFLGAPAGTSYNSSWSHLWNTPTGFLTEGSNTENANVDNKCFEYSGEYSAYPVLVLMPNLLMANYNPQACLRFENSLTVSVATNVSTSGTNARKAGCLVRLDS